MKIATIIPKLSGGGAEKVAANLSKLLSKVYAHSFIVFNLEEASYDYVGDVVNIDLPSQGSMLQKVIVFYRRFKKVLQLKKKNQFDVVFSHLYVPNIINALSAKQSKTVLVIHGAASVFQNTLEKKLAQWAYHKADRIVTVSHFYAQRVVQELQIPRQKVVTIYNPIDFGEINQKKNENLSEQELLLFSNNKIFIHVGRLNAEKGQHHAIMAFSKIRAEQANVKLVFLGVGQDDYVNLLKSMTLKLGIDEDVLFLGNVQNPYKYMSRSFALFFTSVREALPTVLIEALACGLPIISSDCDSGPREILAPNTDIMKRTNAIEKTNYGYLVSTCNGLKSKKQELSKSEENFATAGLQLMNDTAYYQVVKNNLPNRAKSFDGSAVKASYKKLIESMFDED